MITILDAVEGVKRYLRLIRRPNSGMRWNPPIRSRQARFHFLNDRVHPVIGGDVVRRDGNVCSAVQRQPALVTGAQVLLVGEDGPGMFGSPAAVQGGFELHVEMNEQGAGG